MLPTPVFRIFSSDIVCR